jgi:methionyl-tRNA synthetase
MPDAAATKPTIDYTAFSKLDLRVATVVSAEHHPNADKLLKIRLDDGTEGGRQVCAGIRAWYEPQDLVGRQVVIVANLEPRNLRGEPSEGMILCASRGDPREPEDVVLLILDRAVPPGSAVT